jgi:exopolysaccharide production protein ExoQ
MEESTPYWHRRINLATEQPRSRLRIIEAMAAGLVVLMMSNALLGPLFDPLQTGGDSHPLLRQIWLPVYAVILGLAAWRWRELKRAWFPILLLLVLLGWTFASVTWSVAPDITMRRAVAVSISSLFGVYLAASFGGRGMSEILAACFLILAIGSYVAALAFPAIGVHHDVNAGLWKGLWYEKNQMGALMVYGSLAALSAALTSPPRRLLWIGTLVLCAGLVIMTHSATSLISLLLVLGGTATLSLMGRGAAASVAAVWAGVTGLTTLIGVYALAPQLLFEAVGKDPSLTGRAQIWAAILRESHDAPLTGYGYAAFWTRGSAPAKWIRAQLQWPVPTAHNGWLDLLIQLGQIGVALFALIMGAALIFAFIRRRRLRDGYFAPLFLVVYFISIQSESFILIQNEMAWMLAVAAMVRVLGPLPARSRPRLRAPTLRKPPPPAMIPAHA